MNISKISLILAFSEHLFVTVSFTLLRFDLFESLGGWGGGKKERAWDARRGRGKEDLTFCSFRHPQVLIIFVQFYLKTKKLF